MPGRNGMDIGSSRCIACPICNTHWAVWIEITVQEVGGTRIAEER